MIYCCSVILSPILSNKKHADKIEKSRINTDFFSILSNKKLFLGSIGTHGSGGNFRRAYKKCVGATIVSPAVPRCPVKPFLNWKTAASYQGAHTGAPLHIIYKFCGYFLWRRRGEPMCSPEPRCPVKPILNRKTAASYPRACNARPYNRHKKRYFLS